MSVLGSLHRLTIESYFFGGGEVRFRMGQHVWQNILECIYAQPSCEQSCCWYCQVSFAELETRLDRICVRSCGYVCFLSFRWVATDHDALWPWRSGIMLKPVPTMITNMDYQSWRRKLANAQWSTTQLQLHAQPLQPSHRIATNVPFFFFIPWTSMCASILHHKSNEQLVCR